AEGWAGFVDGGPPPRHKPESTYESVTDARSWLDRIEQRAADEVERRKRDEEAHAGTYAGWTHDELVAELRVMKFNINAAETRERNWREAMEHEKPRFAATIGRLRDALKGRKTASVDDLNAALKEEN
ncbi:hypothetical protein HRW07_33695, partial [Streptomyces lunaelactis]|uniref:hypothetical protein n=1 Tax=Streptomyces lunaelactis TaxID=1535768 RepID=UPI0015853705